MYCKSEWDDKPVLSGNQQKPTRIEAEIGNNYMKY